MAKSCPLTCKLIMKRWKLVKKTGIGKYEECMICESRRYTALTLMHSPIDKDWLNHRKDNLSNDHHHLPPQAR